jgi:hypothetical protein
MGLLLIVSRWLRGGIINIMVKCNWIEEIPKIPPKKLIHHKRTSQHPKTFPIKKKTLQTISSNYQLFVLIVCWKKCLTKRRCHKTNQQYYEWKNSYDC